ncbi:MAG: 30S ribosomal protein S8 [candidate division KSB1 bacterium]|nr:30S ribosomal protein S8 [candidate division KSB1 bacterium]MDZ7301364.1 30S ribosomal protein S8 [candidate division KSB1 bacterium]MDZ7310751.1 30S ribosomal protein S8 [candidate division KSB1 bacterium]
MQTDPIADFLSCIRNAGRAGHRSVDVPASRIKTEIARLLQFYGYIQDFLIIKDNKQNILRLYLKYDENGKPVINGLRRVSKPGVRRYVGVKNLPRVFNNLGIAILSTPKGILAERDARKLNVGGEVLCYVW